MLKGSLRSAATDAPGEPRRRRSVPDLPDRERLLRHTVGQAALTFCCITSRTVSQLPSVPLADAAPWGRASLESHDERTGADDVVRHGRCRPDRQCDNRAWAASMSRSTAAWRSG